MILNEPFSEVGRSTSQHLDNLRRQLGVGVDPAYDYSHMTELQKQLTSKKDKRPKTDGLTGSSALDQLRKALKEATTPAVVDGSDKVEEPMTSSGMSSIRSGQKKNGSPSWSFKTTTREYLASLSTENRWRAPPVGSYRPRAEVCESRVKDVDFGTKERTRSLRTVSLEKEVERLQDEGRPVEHLVKPCTSVELLDEKPERVGPRQKSWSFSKDLDRPDLVKSANLHFNDNTFDAGVLQGDLSTSKFLRMPVFEFVKTDPKVKPQETFFQPGQYKVNFALTRPSLKMKASFDAQMPRKPLRETVGRTEIKSRPGDHLPDRSLSRSCPALSNYKRDWVPTFDHYSERPPIAKPQKPYHKADDPSIDQAVFQHSMTHDEMESAKATWSRVRTVEKFEDSLERLEHFKTQRSYGQNVMMHQAKENLSRGPNSVELLSEIGNSPVLRPRVLAIDFASMPEREGHQRKHVELPPRNKDMSGQLRFERASRQGDCKTEVDLLSPLSTAISKKRSLRKYDGFEVSEAT